MKKALSLVLVLCMVFAFCACGQDSEPADDANDEVVEIEYWNLTMTDMPFESDLIAQFEADNPNIKVNVVQVPVENFHDKLILAAETDTLPDVAQGIPEWTADMYDAGVLKEITNDITDVQEIYGDAINLCGWDGGFYGLPFRFGTNGIFINSELAEKAGVEIPETWTWDEFVAIAEKLTDKDNGVYGFGLPGAATGDLGLSWDWLTFALANGSGFITDNKAAFNDEAGADALDKVIDLMDKGVIPESATSFTAADIVDAFGSGKVAMFMNGPWYIATVKASYPDMDFITAPVPTIAENPASYSVNGGTYLSICSTTEKYAAALTFIKYMTGENIMRQWASQGEFLPAVQSLMTDDEFTSGLISPWAYMATLPSTTIAATVENTNLMEILQTEINHAMAGEKSSADALNDAAAKWDDILANHYN